MINIIEANNILESNHKLKDVYLTNQIIILHTLNYFLDTFKTPCKKCLVQSMCIKEYKINHEEDMSSNVARWAISYIEIKSPCKKLKNFIDEYKYHEKI